MKIMSFLLIQPFLLVLLIQQIQTKCYNLTEITNTNTTHTDMLAIMKINSNYTKLFTVGGFGNLKIWELNFTQPSLKLKHSIKINNGFYDFYEGFFVWNDGLKIFTSQCPEQQYLSCNLAIFTYDSQSDSYNIGSPQRISIRNSINSITVNKKGDTIYFGQYCQGISRYQFNGSNWINNTPSYLKQNIFGCMNYITLTEKQDKLIALYYDYNEYGTLIKIFARNSDSQEYVLHQTINPGLYDTVSCHLSNNEKFINCFGRQAKYINFMYDQKTDLFINVSKHSKQTFTADSFMDDNQVFTTVSYINNQKLVQNFKFQFDQETNKSTYSLFNRFQIPNAMYVNKVVGHQKFQFQILAAWTQEQLTRIYITFCNLKQRNPNLVINQQKQE